MVFATRGSQKRYFDDHVWKEMPPHKYGWAQAADYPDEIQALLEQKDPPPPPEHPLTEKERIEKELQTPGLHHMVKKKLEKRLSELDADSN